MIRLALPIFGLIRVVSSYNLAIIFLLAVNKNMMMLEGEYSFFSAIQFWWGLCIFRGDVSPGIP